VRTFITRHADCSRRGIGFDMKELNANKSQNLSSEASENTFGHLGFTGTSVWADPDNHLIYVFLSNRTYPSMHNYMLNKEDIRPRIQSVIYKAIQS
jgi:beta-N-acetylhexosaminidase